jgi:uncharacterized protein YkwD
VKSAAAALALWALLTGTGATADAGRLEAELNALRGRPAECAGGPAYAAPALASSASLADVAAAINASPGMSLTAAMTRAGYRSRRTVLWHLTGVGLPSALARYAEKNFCRDLHAGDLSEIGIFQTGTGGVPDTWIVLAQPIVLPEPDAGPAIGRRMLLLVNRARASGRLCGRRRFGSAPPLVWDDRLAAAGLAHAVEMAQYQYMEHTGRNGSRPGDRARSAGYAWTAIGENIASGQSTVEEVTAGWMASPPHCANLMSAAYSAMGAGYAVNPGSKMGVYWDQMFGAPR